MVNNPLRTLVRSVTEQALDDTIEQDFNITTQAQQNDPYEWQCVQKDLWKRNCLGHEASASFNQNLADGHTELSCVASFLIHHPSSSRTTCNEFQTDELVARTRQAWVQTRYLRPEVAVELDRHTDPTLPQTMTYKVLRDEQSLQQWMNETLVVKRLGDVDANTLESVLSYTYNRPLPTKGKNAMLYLLLPKLGEDENPSAHVIINISHAVSDGGSIADCLNVLLQCMIDAAPKPPYDSFYTPSNFELNVLPRLPCSVVVAYQQQYSPTAADVAAAYQAAMDNTSLTSGKIGQSLALTPVESWTKRKHQTICLTKVMKADEAKELLRFAKQNHSGITYLTSAAIIFAMAETYPERKESSLGALMGMVRHTRRWLSTTPAHGAWSTSTPLGSDSVSLWIPVNTDISLEPSYDQLRSLVCVARQIRNELDKHLTTPHCISSYAAVADSSIRGLAQQWSQIKTLHSSSTHEPTQEKIDSVIGAQAPGFSSLGVFKLHPRFHPSSASARASGLWLERSDFTHTGRQVNASPWISMLTIDGRLKFQLGFDAKFHQEEKMQQWLDRMFAWLQICASAASATSSAGPVSASLYARL